MKKKNIGIPIALVMDDIRRFYVSNVQCKFKRVIKSAFLFLVVASVTNCSQFASFTGDEEAKFYSENPVFPDTTFVGNDRDDEGVAVQPEPPVTPEPPPKKPDVVAPTPKKPKPKPKPKPPFVRCGKDKKSYRFLLSNNKYGKCGPCAVLSNNKKRCVVVKKPPVVKPPAPPAVPVVPSNTGGGGDGGGGGDPLMIDTVGVEYADANHLRNSNDSYFNSGELELTDERCEEFIAEGQNTKEKCEDDKANRQSFSGFKLLGQQDEARLYNGDILHINSKGQNLSFQKMSWTRKSQDRYRFLALPNSKGNIDGVNELFGDNTFGPDKSFADDGFEALKKYDRGDAAGGSNLANGYIDANDAVFSKLRLWHDYNGDGNVDTAIERMTELVSLDAKGITYISLHPNKNFDETDFYGNMIAYKALVGFSTPRGGGIKLGTAFDMWFHYDSEEIVDAGFGHIEEKE